MLGCKACGAAVDVTLTSCLACGEAVPIGQFGALLGLVCRRCEAYNDPGSPRCVACQEPLGLAAERAAAAPARGSPAATLTLPAVTPPTTPAATPPVAPALAAAPRAPPPAPPSGAPPSPAALPETLAAAAPARRLAVKLIVERGRGPDGQAFTVGGTGLPGTPAVARIGRTEGELRFPDDPCLVARHATLTVDEEAVLLRDESPEGGVYVRMRGLTLPLRPGALFAIGDHLLRFAGPLPPPHAAAAGVHRLGSPRPQGAAVVIEEQVEGGITGRVYVRAGPSITIGRSGCSINLGDDPYVSQRHAEIVVEADGRARLRDLESSNGTFSRLPPGAERELHDGDRLRVGHQILRVEIA